MNIEKKNVKDLLPADYNPRKDLKPGDPEYEKLKRSIEQFGYVEPVIWNKATGRVVGGHQRLKVLIDMGISEVECVVGGCRPLGDHIGGVGVEGVVQGGLRGGPGIVQKLQRGAHGHAAGAGHGHTLGVQLFHKAGGEGQDRIGAAACHGL